MTKKQKRAFNKQIRVAGKKELRKVELEKYQGNIAKPSFEFNESR